MRRMTFKNRLILSWFGVVVLVMIASTVTVSLVVRSQNRMATNQNIKTSLENVRDHLSTKKEDVLSTSRQMASPDNTGFVLKAIFGAKEEDVLTTFESSFVEMTRILRQVAITGGFWKAGVFDQNGDLRAYAVRGGNGLFSLGYFYGVSPPKLRSASLGPKGELTSAVFKDTEELQVIPLDPRFERDIPKKEVVGFEEVEGFLCIVSYVPVMAKVYNKETGNLEERQWGVVIGIKRLGEAFLKRMSRITGMEINIFSNKGLALGDLAEYRSLISNHVGAGAGEKEDALEEQRSFLNEINVMNEGYYQGVMPLYGASGAAGAIAVLESKAVSRANTYQMIKLLALVAIGCLLLTLPIALVFSKSLTRPLNSIINTLSEAAERVSSASHQVSSSSHHVAQSASEQASSLEETSSSLEEMSSMTNQNAEHAKEADRLSKESIGNMEDANTSMKTLRESMDEASRSSANVAKIIKTIDEIAFQTNLLALNAAVEAARAGEAGAGFAVVADEVRNLALRSAEAAANTRNLVEDITGKIDTGSELVNETDDKYRQVALSVQKVSELMGEISASSNEQAQGIEQLNKAVAEMDKTVQQDAASAQESASSAGEMDSQAGEMNRVLDELSWLTGAGRGRTPGSAGKAAETPARDTGVEETLPVPKGGKVEALQGSLKPTTKRDKEQDLEFTDF